VRNVDSRLNASVGSFEAAWGHPIAHPVIVAQQAANTLCERWPTGEVQVSVSQAYLSGNPSNLEVSIWHELGHCTLGRLHKDSTVAFNWSNGTYPASIMNSVAFSNFQVNAFNRERAYYTNELFNGI